MGDVAVASHARHKGHAVHDPSNCLSVCLSVCSCVQLTQQQQHTPTTKVNAEAQLS